MPDAFSLWLQRKYGTPAALSAAWRRPVASFDQARPLAERLDATSRDDLPPMLDWHQFTDARAAPDRQCGPMDDLPLVQAGSHGGGAYAALYERTRIAARHLRPDGTFPSAAEVCRQVVPQGTDDDATDFALRAALMHGAAPDRLPDSIRAGAASALMEVLRSEPWQADRKLLILYPRVYAHMKRLAERMGRHGTPAGDMTFGFERPIQTAGPLLLKKLIDLTARAGFPFALGDTRLPLDIVRRYALVVCPTFELLSAGAMRTLAAFAIGGGFLALGPRIPVMDETLRADDTLARHFPAGLSEFGLEVRHARDGAFLTLPGHLSAATIEFLAFESGLAKGLVAESPGVDSAVHRAGNRRLLFVANPTGSPVETTLSGEPFRALRHVETGAESTPSAAAALTVPPRSVSAWEVV